MFAWSKSPQCVLWSRRKFFRLVLVISVSCSTCVQWLSSWYWIYTASRSRYVIGFHWTISVSSQLRLTSAVSDSICCFSRPTLYLWLLWYVWSYWLPSDFNRAIVSDLPCLCAVCVVSVISSGIAWLLGYSLVVSSPSFSALLLRSHCVILF